MPSVDAPGWPSSRIRDSRRQRWATALAVVGGGKGACVPADPSRLGTISLKQEPCQEGWSLLYGMEQYRLARVGSLARK